jgi:uncharacterized repeat protein (TIGR01451 family)
MMKSQTPALRASLATALRCGMSFGACTVAVAFALTSVPAFAAGTIAGTDIDNIAEATYETPSGPVTIQSNTVRIKVDELIDVTVVTTDPGDITTAPGATGNVQTFRITNTGNGEEAYRLTANGVVGGDDFDPAVAQIVLDTNGNGVYDPGVDTVYIAGSNDPVLQPDQSSIVFVITTTPIAVTNGNRGTTNLLAVAVTGSGAPGTSFPGAGQGGGNAVIGTTGADADANSFLAVQAAILALVKSATIVDPFGGNRPVPGATVTYSIVATVSGAGALTNLIIADSIPVGVTYQPGTLSQDTVVLTDATDADAGNFNGSRITVNAGNVAAGQTRTVIFKSVIK